MEGVYGVSFGNQVIGKVSVKRQGLYYHVSCRCQLTGEMIYRLRISSANREENLGILVPMDGGFGLDTKIPVKRLGEGHPDFMLIPKYEQTAGMFVPVYPDEPFSYISRLKSGFLERKNGQIGIVLK